MAFDILFYSFFFWPYMFKLWVTQEIILLSSSFKLSVHHNFLQEKELLNDVVLQKSIFLNKSYSQDSSKNNR